MREHSPAVCAAVKIAHRQFDALNDAEREQVLIALVETGADCEAGAANDALYYSREARKAQLKLKGILEGVK
jgi:hypothetical protein